MQECYGANDNEESIKLPSHWWGYLMVPSCHWTIFQIFNAAPLYSFLLGLQIPAPQYGVTVVYRVYRVYRLLSNKKQTLCFKTRSLDLSFSDFLAGKPEYIQTYPAGRILFSFWSPKSDKQWKSFMGCLEYLPMWGPWVIRHYRWSLDFTESDFLVKLEFTLRHNLHHVNSKVLNNSWRS